MTVPSVTPGGEIEADWGNAVATELNGVTATAAGKVSKSGDTMTGNLQINDGGLKLNGTGYQARTIELQNAGIRQIDIMENTEGGYFAIRRFTADGTAVVARIEITPNGNISLFDSTRVLVPPINGIQQPAQVTAYNPTTGQLAIGGHEIGDTGLRNITNLLAAGWDTQYGQQLTLRRSGNTVYLGGDINTGATPANSFLTLPLGFFPMAVPSSFEVGFMLRSEMDEAKAQWYRVVHYSGEIIPVWQPMAPQTPYCRFHATWLTNQAWPTSLPGVVMAATQADEGESE